MPLMNLEAKVLHKLLEQTSPNNVLKGTLHHSQVRYKGVGLVSESQPE